MQFEPSFTLERGYLHYATLQIAEKLASLLDIESSVYRETISAFETLPHRLEFVKKVNGISFVNDSISTIPEATIAAVKMLKNVDSVIIGGNDRGVNYEQLVTFLQTSSVQNIILFSDTGRQIYGKLSNTLEKKNLFLMQNLQESIEKAYNVATSVVLFSPAASSFNEYKNFVERGDEFKKIVNNLEE
ncbi:UDP-N-acetylmuramoylalanine--D-glutamate ligase [hydrothermal vent metagenome]|uniref:UDP-N-acetylmuramoylalanine--D-glutamate ligase n=1 Tax=hydrothermal vent metagenome TaxID=652676 RepID=A0A1W1BXB3_9ZZZZ